MTLYQRLRLPGRLALALLLALPVMVAVSTPSQSASEPAASASSAPGNAAARDADLDHLARLAQERLARATGDSSLKVTSVRSTPVAGLFEVVTNDRQLYYSDSEARFMVVSGQLIDMASLKNLTADRMREVNAIPFESLPLDLAIKVVKGNGKRRLAVFSDTDCPFCMKLERELANVTDVTIYTFLYPIAQLHPNAEEHSRRLWCAPDRAKAWADYWAHSTLPEARSCDLSALAQIEALGHEHNISATPSLVFASGEMIPGALPTAELERHLGPR